MSNAWAQLLSATATWGLWLEGHRVLGKRWGINRLQNPGWDIVWIFFFFCS